MPASPEDSIRYSILDPTGNITALVESSVEVREQPEVAAAIMERHPEVEQVGFLSLGEEEGEGVAASLRMAGGEFCGNASLCAATLYCMREGLEPKEDQDVWLCVSGAHNRVGVRLHKDGAGYRAGIRMPEALKVEQVELQFGGESGLLTLVRMEGISHLVIPPTSSFHTLLERREAAELAVRTWCEELSAEGLGLMFVSGDGEARTLVPLVFVSCGETLFWENSCASGSSAVAISLAREAASVVDVTFDEPGGTLRVTSDPETGETWLFGNVVPILEGQAL